MSILLKAKLGIGVSIDHLGLGVNVPIRRWPGSSLPKSCATRALFGAMALTCEHMRLL
jgi:hypothetical protein